MLLHFLLKTKLDFPCCKCNVYCSVFKPKRVADSRMVFGPELVMLGPDEQFTQLSLSGGRPKKPNQIRSLVLLLGPDFCTDIIVVETADHARLQLQLSYNWLDFVFLHILASC
jgi:hypothetical protein